MGQAAIDSLIAELQSGKHTKEFDKIPLLMELSDAYAPINPDEGIKYGLQGWQLAAKIPDKKSMANLKRTIGVNYDYKSDYNAALKYFSDALMLFREIGDKKGIAGINMEIGTIYFYQSNFPKALAYYFTSLKSFEEIDNKRGIANVLQAIGSVYQSYGNYILALEYEFKALKLNIANGNKVGIANTTGNIGTTYNAMANYTLALEYFVKDLALREEMGDRSEVGITLENIAATYIHLGKYRLALDYSMKALKLNKESGYKLGIAQCFENIGESYFFIAKDTAHNLNADSRIPGSKSALIRKAIEYLEKALAISREINAPELMQSTYGNLADVCKLAGDYKNALRFFETYNEIKDSIFSQESKIKITQLETQRSLDLKDKDILIKNKQIELDKLAVAKKRNERGFYLAGIGALIVAIGRLSYSHREKLKRTKAEQQALFSKRLLEIELKALRAQMNPHFIFNCLNSIQAFILKENKIEATDYLQKFSKLIRMILDSSQKTTNTIEDEAEILSLYIDLEKLRLKNKFDFEIEIAADIDPSFTEIPSMVIQPLVENSIWHGLMYANRKGTLRVAFTKGSNQLRCIVEDNGIGREESKRRKESQGRKHTSKGIQLIEDRLKAWSQTKGLRYTFNIADNADQLCGTRTEITIFYPTYA
jgi:tetratricopeptide (TPR) repeat protein